MSVDEVLNRIADTYLKCLSYSDSGTIETSGFGQPQSTIEFETYFVRPRLFRFEWTERDEHFMIWSDGSKSYERYQFANQKTEPVENFEQAIAGATGISYGGAWTILSLLIPELRARGRTLLQIRDLTLLGDEEMNGCSFHVLKGSSKLPEDTTLWVSARDFTVRRIREDYEITTDRYKKDTEDAIATFTDLRKQSRISKEEFQGFYDAITDRAPLGDLHYLKECTYKELHVNEPIPTSTFNTPAG